VRPALRTDPSRPKTSNTRFAGYSERGIAPHSQIQDVTKPRFSVGVSNRLLKGVTSTGPFSLGRIVPWLDAWVSSWRAAFGPHWAWRGAGGAWVSGPWRCLPGSGKQRQWAGVAYERRRHAPKKNPARGRALEGTGHRSGYNSYVQFTLTLSQPGSRVNVSSLNAVGLHVDGIEPPQFTQPLGVMSAAFHNHRTSGPFEPAVQSLHQLSFVCIVHDKPFNTGNERPPGHTTNRAMFLVGRKSPSLAARR